jgi:hypothetical protein
LAIAAPKARVPLMRAEDRGLRPDAGIVHQHVNTAEALDDRPLQCLQRRLVGDIGFGCKNVFCANDGLELGTCLGELFLAEIGDDDAHACLGKMLCRRKADTGGAAGNDGNVGWFENLLNIRHGTGSPRSVVRTKPDMGWHLTLSNTIRDRKAALPGLASCDNLAKSARDTGLCGLPLPLCNGPHHHGT